MRRGTKVSGTNENPLLEGTRKRKMEDGKRGRGKRKTEEKIKKREENGGSYFALWTWTRVVWSFTLSWCIRTWLETGAKGRGERRRRIKKKYIPSSLHTVYPDLWSLAPSQMKFPCRWKHGQFFILRFPYGARAGRVTYFSVLTSKWTSLVYHIYSTRPIPRNRCKERGKETICLKSRSAPFPRYICYINSIVCPVLSGIFNCTRAFFLSFHFLFFYFRYMDVQRTDGIYRRLTTLNEPFFNQVFILVSFNLVLPFLSHTHIHIYIFIKK